MVSGFADMHGDGLRQQIAALPRGVKKMLFVVFDFVALTLILWLSFCAWKGALFVPDLPGLLLLLAAPLVALPIFVRMGLYRAVLRYLPERAIWKILQAATIATLVWVCIAFLTRTAGREDVPRAVAVAYWILSVGTIAGSRFGAKHLLWDEAARRGESGRTLIYGAGDAATQLAGAFKSVPGRRVMGFVSEDTRLQGLDILGIRVYPTDRIEALVADFGIDEVIIATPRSGNLIKRDLIARLGPLPVKIRILPAIADLAAGKHPIGAVRDIDIDDLLRRSPVPADPELMRKVVEGRVILITGAAGSIGSALSRTVARLNPARMILMDLNEHGLFALGREIAASADVPVRQVLGSVNDASLARQVLCGEKVQTLFHCAAFKHVSMVEANCIEGVRNNVVGTWTIAAAAHDCGVRNFVLISSDKAVRPTSVMGATKRWAELIVRHHGARRDESGSKRNFASVRLGNVIGSSGSVVPLFKEQIRAGGPVTLTHWQMTRYFMSVRETAELIIQAGALAKSGDVLLLEMGEPVSIRDLAEDMILLAGSTVRSEDNPDGDIEIVTIGAAPGEKLHEELAYDPSGLQPTSHPKILRARQRRGPMDDLPSALARLCERLDARDETAVRQLLFEMV